jgi:hypothetical protein
MLKCVVSSVVRVAPSLFKIVPLDFQSLSENLLKYHICFNPFHKAKGRKLVKSFFFNKFSTLLHSPLIRRFFGYAALCLFFGGNAGFGYIILDDNIIA